MEEQKERINEIKNDFQDGLQDIKNRYQVPNFTTINRPVFTKDGDIIEKPNKEEELSVDGFIDILEKPNNEKNLFGNESSDIIDSVTLLRIQEDFKMLENRYALTCAGFEFISNAIMAHEIEEKEKMAEKDKIIAIKNKTIEDFTKLATSQNTRLEVLLKTVSLQTENINQLNVHMESLKTTLSDKDTEIVELKETVVELKETIEKKNGAFTECFKLKAESEMREAKLLSELALERHENREFREKSQIGPGTMRSQSVPVESKKIPIEEGKLGHSWDPIIGLRDTLLNGIPFTLAREKQEQRIKNFYNEEYSALDNKEIGKLFAKDKTLVDCIGMPDTPSSLFYGQRDKTPLMLAAGRGNLQNVKFLVESNANVNYVDRTKSTALDYAYRFWDRDKIKNTSQVYHYLKDEKHALSGDDYVIEPAIKTPSK